MLEPGAAQELLHDNVEVSLSQLGTRMRVAAESEVRSAGRPPLAEIFGVDQDDIPTIVGAFAASAIDLIIQILNEADAALRCELQADESRPAIALIHFDIERIAAGIVRQRYRLDAEIAALPDVDLLALSEDRGLVLVAMAVSAVATFQEAWSLERERFGFGGELMLGHGSQLVH